jgi:hypothetical protein
MKVPFFNPRTPPDPPRYDGTFVGIFADVNEPRGLLLLPFLDPPQVAVCSGVNKKIAFLSKADGMDGGKLVGNPGYKSDALNMISIEGNFEPRSLALVQKEITSTSVPANETEPVETTTVTSSLLVSFVSTAGALRNTQLHCIPGAPCAHPQNNPRDLVSWLDGYHDVAVMPDGLSYLMFHSVLGKMHVLQCYFAAASSSPTDACSIFTGPPDGVGGEFETDPDWAPKAVFVDNEREVVMIADEESNAIYACDLQGTVLASMSTPAPLSSMTIKDGAFGSLSKYAVNLSPSSVESIRVPVALHDRFDEPIDMDSYPLLE